jgi:hypothetical protein
MRMSNPGQAAKVGEYAARFVEVVRATDKAREGSTSLFRDALEWQELEAWERLLVAVDLATKPERKTGR